MVREVNSQYSVIAMNSWPRFLSYDKTLGSFKVDRSQIIPPNEMIKVFGIKFKIKAGIYESKTHSFDLVIYNPYPAWMWESIKKSNETSQNNTAVASNNATVKKE